MGLRLSLSKAYRTPLQKQSHGLGMTPVSIEQLRATLGQKSIRTQKAVRDKTGRQSQIQWCKLKVDTNKHERNIPSEDEIYPLKRDSKSTKQRSTIKIYCKNMQKHQKRICVFNLLKT
jgi:hypothetical protein